MKNFWGIVVSLLLITGCHTSKNPVRFSLSESIEPVSWSQFRQQYPADSAVYVFYRHEIAHDLKPDFTSNAPRWYFFESFHWKEALLTPPTVEGDALLFAIELSSDEKVRELAIRLVQPDASVDTYSMRDMKKERLAGDSTRFRIEAPVYPPGTLLEVAYEIEREGLYKNIPVSHDVPLQLDKPVLDYTFAYTYPWAWDIQIKHIDPVREVEFVETRLEKPEAITLQYEASRLPAFRQEPLGPYFKQVAPYFHVQVKHLEVGNVLEYTAPDAWLQVADRFTRYTTEPSRRQRTKAMGQLSEMGIHDGLTDRQKVHTVLALLEGAVEVGGVNELDDLLKDQRGGVFGVAAYMRLLLEEAGFDVDFLVAHSAVGGFFDEAFYSSEQVYRPVLHVNLEGRPMYLFPGLEGAPLGYLPPAYAGQPALHFRGDVFEGISSLPVPPESAFTDNGEFNLFINADGEVRARATLDLGPHSTFRFHRAWRQAPEAEQTGVVKGLLPHPAASIAGFQYRIEETGAGGNARITAEYGLKGCLRNVGETVELDACGVFDAYNAAWHPFDAPRTTPLIASAPVVVENEVNVIYPSQWTLVTPVGGKRYVSDWAILDRRVAQSAGKLHVAQRLELPRYEGSFASGPVAEAFRLVPEYERIDALALSTVQEVQVIVHEDGYVGGPWTLVLNSFTELEKAIASAESYQSRLGANGYSVRVLNVIGEAHEYRVVAGFFETRSGIETARATLAKAIPFDSWMLSIKPRMTAVTGQSAEPIRH